MAHSLKAPFFSLPSELINNILTFLPLSDLLSVGLVNRALQEHSLQDTLYQPLVQANVPGSTLRKPEHSTWRELFKTHHPYWFIAKNKIWFADNAHTGKLVIARYNHRLNAIEAYAIVAERRHPAIQVWDAHPEAIIHSFHPRIQLDLNAATLHLDASTYAEVAGEQKDRLQGEMQMAGFTRVRSAAGLYTRLILTRPWPSERTYENTPVWPPLTIPSPVRTRTDSATQFRGASNRPAMLEELSTATFRIRNWMQFSPRIHTQNIHFGEQTTTWATIPEECYTPTRRKPWQGIWCGDYAGHGCEFLAIMQPDNPKPLPERAERAMRVCDRLGSDDSSDSWTTAPTESPNLDEETQARSSTASSDSHTNRQGSAPTSDSSSSRQLPSSEEDDSIYSGRIEAVKLTGDPNIPRGEYTFIAPDIGPKGLIRVARDNLFQGARIVRSLGHIAGAAFTDDDYIPSQLILISHDRLAQYWEAFGHVSFYQRVNIEEFTRIP